MTRMVVPKQLQTKSKGKEKHTHRETNLTQKYQTMESHHQSKEDTLLPALLRYPERH